MQHLSENRAESSTLDGMQGVASATSNLPDFEAGTTLLFDKPLGWTSFDVVAKVRNLIGNRKLRVGHAGTLDPLATGLLIVCTGKHTKQIDGIQAQGKAYQAAVKFGAITASYDAETPETDVKDASFLTPEAIEALFPPFIGEIQQLPPVFSALKVDGKRAYESARAGQEVVLQPRTISMYSMTLLGWEAPVANIDIRCGKGTYVRALARDLGEAAGTGAYLTGLRRTHIGAYDVANAYSMEAFASLLGKELNGRIRV